MLVTDYYFGRMLRTLTIYVICLISVISAKGQDIGMTIEQVRATEKQLRLLEESVYDSTAQLLYDSPRHEYYKSYEFVHGKCVVIAESMGYEDGTKVLGELTRSCYSIDESRFLCNEYVYEVEKMPDYRWVVIVKKKL